MWLSRFRRKTPVARAAAAATGVRRKMASYRQLRPSMAYWLSRYREKKLWAADLVTKWLQDRPESLTPAQLTHPLTHMEKPEHLRELLQDLNGSSARFPGGSARGKISYETIATAFNKLNPLVRDGTIYAAKLSNGTSLGELYSQPRWPAIVWDNRQMARNGHARVVQSILRNNFMAVLNWFRYGSLEWDEELYVRNRKSLGQWSEGTVLHLYCQKRSSGSVVWWQIDLHMTDIGSGELVMYTSYPLK